MIKNESVAEIVRSLPKPKALKQGIEQYVQPYFPIINPGAIVKQIKQKAVIQVLHPEQRSGSAYEKDPKYQENRAFDYLACLIIYWWCNIKSDMTSQEQMNFILLQRSDIKDYWGQVVAQTLSEKSKILVVECLRHGISTLHISDSIKDFADFYGDPADFIRIDDLKTWDDAGRDRMLDLALNSKNDKFRRGVAKAAFNDPNVRIRKAARWYVENGKLPDIRNEIEIEEAKKPKIGPADKERTKTLWLKFNREKFPTKYSVASAENSLPGVDFTIRNCIRSILSEKQIDHMEIIALDMALKGLDFEITRIDEIDRSYFERLRSIGFRVLEEARQLYTD